MKHFFIFVFILVIILGVYFVAILNKDLFLFQYDNEYLEIEENSIRSMDDNQLLYYFQRAEIYEYISDQQLEVYLNNKTVMSFVNYFSYEQGFDNIETIYKVFRNRRYIKGTNFGNVICLMNDFDNPSFCIAFTEDVQQIYFYSNYYSTTTYNKAISNRTEKHTLESEKQTEELLQEVKKILNKYQLLSNFSFEPNSFYTQNVRESITVSAPDLYFLQDTKSRIVVTYDKGQSSITELQVKFDFDSIE